MSWVVIIVLGRDLPLTKSVIGVSTKPGHERAVDLMPSFASSLFIACVKPMTACLVAL